jgi:hypothetical protein
MLKPVIAMAALCTIFARAQAFELSGQQISNLIAGATVEIDTPIGTKLPVRYGRDGKLSGHAGELAWYLGTATDHGRWWVASDRLCHKWSRWFNSVPQCLRLSKEGRIIRWRSRDGNGGTARISVPASVQTAAVLPAARPSLPKQVVPPEAPPAPASAPDRKDHSKEQSAASATGAGPPPEIVVQGAAMPPPPVPAGTVAPDRSPPPEKAAVLKRAAQSSFRVANVRTGDVLNVRSGPSADFDVVGALSPDSRGIAITSACQSRWCPVQHYAASGWVNSAFLAADEPSSPVSALRDSPGAPRDCLTPAARALLDRIERSFGPVQVISTCQPGTAVPGAWRASRHASGNAVDFKAGSRKAAIVQWLIANHRSGSTITYAGMDHIHVDIGPHFVSIANGPYWRSSRDGPAEFPEPH